LKKKLGLTLAEAARQYRLSLEGGGGPRKAKERPHALQKLPDNPPPTGARILQLLKRYPRFSSSAKVARDCLISSAKPRLRVMASAV
jgi:hypothetical protein